MKFYSFDCGEIPSACDTCGGSDSVRRVIVICMNKGSYTSEYKTNECFHCSTIRDILQKEKEEMYKMENCL